jgi:hypothetical protein
MRETDALNEFLNRSGNLPADDLGIDTATIVRAAMSGFCALAHEGHTFVSPERIEQEFGRTLSQNYPEAGPTFLKFAHSYWTLKLLVNDPEVRPDFSNAAGTLSQLEEFLAGLFFPTPGPVKVPVAAREAKQREVLTSSAAPFDIDEFIERNPILIRDRSVQGRGCLGILIPIIPYLASRDFLAAIEQHTR